MITLGLFFGENLSVSNPTFPTLGLFFGENFPYRIPHAQD
jgi:hypothetical protein